MENVLLNNRIIKKINYIKTKINVDEMIKNPYEEFKFSVPELNPPKIIDNKLKTSSNIDNIESVHKERCSLIVRCGKFYRLLETASKNLTNQELVYLEHYLNGYSEEVICEILNYSSRSSLRRIKESAIIKIAFYFNIQVYL